MQRDTDLTLGDVVWDFEYHSTEALLRMSESIVADEPHANLRFLKIPYLKQYKDIGSEVVCSLTEKGEHLAETNYVAVSYCWDSFNLPDTTHSGSTCSSPTVLVKQGSGPSRAPRCPSKVLLRAIAFAISREVSLIWIDQECVDQSDPDDIQRHLQYNHTIFSQAKHQIGLLNFQLTKTQVDGLVDLAILHQLSTSEPLKTALLAGYGLKVLLKRIEFATRLFKCLARDRWFTRTWVFQERYSAIMNMALLLPLSTEALEHFDKPLGMELAGEDFCLYVESICTIAVAVRLALYDTAQGELPEETVAARNTIVNALYPLHEAAQDLSGPVFAGTPFDRVFDTVAYGSGHIDRISNLQLHKTFLEMEKCDNRFVSDRLAIMSNLMHFRKKFPTTGFHSYSFALAALFAANDRIPSIAIQVEMPTPPTELFSHTLLVPDLLYFAQDLKKRVADGREELQVELDNVTQILTTFFDGDVPDPAIYVDAVKDANGSDPDLLLNRIIIRDLKRYDVVPLDATIGQLLEGVIKAHHVDNIGIKHTHGEAIVRYGIQTKQLNEGDRFIAFVGDYRWRADFVEKFFVYD